MTTNTCVINKAIQQAGGQSAVAEACGVSQPSVFKWANGKLPRTEWTGETNYTQTIQELQIKSGISPEVLITREAMLQSRGGITCAA